ncbi:MAG: GNAT family N-acetyltransferase [Nitrospirae bacterium]|nr:GNAT family N-acetyltransferase [Nitrospirota bacterium]
MKFKKNYAEGGTTQVFRRGLNKSFYFLYHTNRAYWYKADLSKEKKEIIVDENIHVDFDNKEKTIQYIRDYGYYYPMELITGLQEGHLFTGLRHKDKIIGYNKTGYSFVYIEDYKRIYRLPERIAFTYDIFISPEYRGRNYGAFLLGSICNYLRHKGYKSIWAHIPPWNKASESMHGKLGFKRQEMIAYYHIAGISWTTKDPGKLIQQVDGVV